jgi:hypothetical protein
MRVDDDSILGPRVGPDTRELSSISRMAVSRTSGVGTVPAISTTARRPAPQGRPRRDDDREGREARLQKYRIRDS